MYNVSEEFKNTIKSNSLMLSSKVNFPLLELDDTVISKIDLDCSLVFGEDFEIGTAPMGTCKIETLFVDGEEGLDYNYEEMECTPNLGLKLPDNTVEFIPLGIYTVEKAVKKNNKITLDCVDNMYKAEKDFVNNLMFPTTILEILQSACEQSGITLATTNFANADYVVPNEPVFESITCRQVFAQVAELAGGYAKINRLGDLEILTLGNTVTREITKDHYFEFEMDEVAIGKIDKVIVKVGDETAEEGSGENIYTIVDNMFVQDPNNVVGPIFNFLKDINYTACNFNWQGDFSLDLGDKINIDGYETYILDRKLKYTGGLREDYKAPAKSNVEKNSTGKSNILLDMNKVKTQIKVIEGEISQTIEKVENLVVDAANRLYQSQTNIPFDLNTGAGSIQLFRDSIHPYYKVTSYTDIDLSASFSRSQFAENLAGEEVTISLDVLVDVDRIVSIDGKEYEIKANRWTRIWVTKELPINTTKNVRVRNPYSRKLSRDRVIGTKLIDSLTAGINILYYRNLQVQKGNVPSNWTLTPEELENNINRYQSEIKQLVDNISMMVRKDELSAEFMINAESIVQAINTTDGVGRLKTVKVIVDEYGLTVEDGAIIIRDSNNTAIITSDGLKIMFVYTSSGELNGWQRIGHQNISGHSTQANAYITFIVPEKLNLTNAELIIHSLPSRRDGWSTLEGIPDGTYHARNLRLFKVSDNSNSVYDYPALSTPMVLMGITGRTDITNAVWGGQWTPTGDRIQEKVGNVINHIETGKYQTFGVASTDSSSPSNQRYMGGMKFTLVVEGYLRG